MLHFMQFHLLLMEMRERHLTDVHLLRQVKLCYSRNASHTLHADL